MLFRSVRAGETPTKVGCALRVCCLPSQLLRWKINPHQGGDGVRLACQWYRLARHFVGQTPTEVGCALRVEIDGIHSPHHAGETPTEVGCALREGMTLQRVAKYEEKPPPRWGVLCEGQLCRDARSLKFGETPTEVGRSLRG